MICPAATNVSLLAIAMSFPALIASIVGNKPANPTTAFNTISTSFKEAILIMPSEPK